MSTMEITTRAPVPRPWEARPSDAPLRLLARAGVIAYVALIALALVFWAIAIAHS